MYNLKVKWELDPNQDLGKMIDDFRNSKEYQLFIKSIIDEDIQYYINLIKKINNE